MENLDLIGRVIFGAYWIYSGAMHFIHFQMMSQYSTSKNLPLSQVAVSLSGLIMLASGLAIIFDYFIEYGLWALVVFLVLAAFLFHNFWSDTDPNQRMSNTINFTKNLALVGAILIILARFY